MIDQPTGGIRRAGRAGWLVVAVAAFGLLAGCAPGNAPTGYDETVRKNFINGCTGEGTESSGAGEETCVCVYDWISQNVPFDSQTRASTGDYAGPDFVDLDKTLRDSPEEFPEEIKNALSEQCPGWGTEGPEVTDSTGSTDSTDSTDGVSPMAPTTMVTDTNVGTDTTA